MNSRIAIVSGYFNPLHVGHLRMFHDARDLADRLVVIVNNDQQQMLKKGRIIMPESDRLEIVSSIRYVDRAILAQDPDPSVRETLSWLRREYPFEVLIFANGGDRRDAQSIAETAICKEHDIELIFGVGGSNKSDASSRLIDQLGI
jgi:cytidyltransferase-like protein